jgi:hypothetical protein
MLTLLLCHPTQNKLSLTGGGYRFRDLMDQPAHDERWRGQSDTDVDTGSHTPVGIVAGFASSWIHSRFDPASPLRPLVWVLPPV